MPGTSLKPDARMAYIVDTSRWPLVRAWASDAEALSDPAALDATYAALEQVLARDRPFVTLFDLRGARSDATRRQRLAAWERTHEQAIQRLCVAHSVVLASPVERGLLTAYLWLREPVVPVRAFAGRPEAEQWALAQYQAHQG